MGAMQQALAGFITSSGGGSSFPVVLSTTPSVFSTNVTSHPIAMPATVSSGDLLVCVFSMDGTASVTTPSGWNLMATNSSGASRGAAYYRSADGTEGGTTVDFVSAATEQMVAHVLRIQSGTWSGTPEATIVGVASGSSSVDPPSITPAGGSGSYLIVAVAALRGSATQDVTAFPYANNQAENIILNTAGTGVATCTDNLTGASFDPGAFTQAATNAYKALTVAVKSV